MDANKELRNPETAENDIPECHIMPPENKIEDFKFFVGNHIAFRDLFDLQVKLNHECAQLPTSGSAQSVGLDLYACECVVIPPYTTALVNTGISIKMPRGVYGRVAPRSGLSVKHSLMVNAGVIDADYRGDVKVCLHNLSNMEFKVEIGMRVAQLILEQAIFPVNVKAVETLDETERGEGGFGSTGK